MSRDGTALRRFARQHHPDVGGDPEVFRRGVDRLRRGLDPFDPDPAGDLGGTRPGRGPVRHGPVVAVRRRRFPRSTASAVAAAWRRRRRTRVR